MKWTVRGYDRASGEQISLSVEADGEEAAIEKVGHRMIVERADRDAAELKREAKEAKDRKLKQQLAEANERARVYNEQQAIYVEKLYGNREKRLLSDSPMHPVLTFFTGACAVVGTFGFFGALLGFLDSTVAPTIIVFASLLLLILAALLSIRAWLAAIHHIGRRLLEAADRGEPPVSEEGRSS